MTSQQTARTLYGSVFFFCSPITAHRQTASGSFHQATLDETWCAGAFGGLFRHTQKTTLWHQAKAIMHLLVVNLLFLHPRSGFLCLFCAKRKSTDQLIKLHFLLPWRVVVKARADIITLRFAGVDTKKR